MNQITPLLGPIVSMLQSKKALVLAVALLVVGVLCYLGRVTGDQMLRFAEIVVSAYLVAEGAAKIGSPSSSDTPPAIAPGSAKPMSAAEVLTALRQVQDLQPAPLPPSKPVPPAGP
jgi:hypothetical protein